MTDARPWLASPDLNRRVECKFDLFALVHVGLQPLHVPVWWLLSHRQLVLVVPGGGLRRSRQGRLQSETKRIMPGKQTRESRH